MKNIVIVIKNLRNKYDYYYCCLHLHYLIIFAFLLSQPYLTIKTLEFLNLTNFYSFLFSTQKSYKFF